MDWLPVQLLYSKSVERDYTTGARSQYFCRFRLIPLEHISEPKYNHINSERYNGA